MKTRHKFAVVLAGASLVGTAATAVGADLAAATTPAAVRCAYGTISSTPNGSAIGYTITCTGVNHNYQVYATCTDELRGNSGTYYGNVAKPGYTSAVVCPKQGGVQWLASNPRLNPPS